MSWITPEVLENPFFCGTLDRSDKSDEWDSYEEKYYPDFEAAETAYYHSVKDVSKFGFLGELGEYLNHRDKPAKDWIIFLSNHNEWWEEKGIALHDPRITSRGFGVPWDKDGVYAVKYKSISTKEAD